MFNVTVSGGRDTRDPRTLDWTTRQARAVIPFKVENGLPINPEQGDLPEGQGELWHHGEAVAADAIVIAVGPTGPQRLLMIERDDDHGYAVPGGGLDEGETALAAVVRELKEETGLELGADEFDLMPGRYVPDPRAGRNAWMVTIPGVATLYADTPPAVVGADDARRAVWVDANTYAELEAAIHARGGKVFPAHVAMLRDVLR